MRLYSNLRISRPSKEKVPSDKVDAVYTSLRSRTFWGATVAYSLYYVCRMSLSVVKLPLIDQGILSAVQLGFIGSAMLFVYALGKFLSGFFADYCNIRRFMALGLLVSSSVNLILGACGMISAKIALPGAVIMITFAVLWSLNGLSQSMGAAPGVISLSRWFPKSTRGSWYGIFSASPYIGEFVAFILLGQVVARLGWEAGFFAASIVGFIGAGTVLIFVSDTPESKGLPSITAYSGEKESEIDRMATSDIQKRVLRHPGIWIIALSSAFIYMTKYALTGWGVLFLQQAKQFSLEGATSVVAFSAVPGIVGTVLAGWLSDKVFSGDRAKPALIAGLLSAAALGAFLFIDGGYMLNILFVSVFSLCSGVLYCIVAGLMAIDIVPRKATGAAIGIVGISSYVAAGLQDILSGWLIDECGQDFTAVASFWMIAALAAFLLPVLNWKKMKH